MYYKIQESTWESCNAWDDWLLDDRVTCYYYSTFEKARAHFEELLAEARTLVQEQPNEFRVEVHDKNVGSIMEFEVLRDNSFDYGYDLFDVDTIPNGYELDSGKYSIEYYDEDTEQMKVYELEGVKRNV